MKIRQARLEDVEKLSALLVKATKNIYKDFLSSDHLEKIKDDQYEMSLKNIIKKDDKTCLVLEDEGKIIGLTSFYPSRLKAYKGHLELEKIYLDPAYIGRGLGSLLMEKIKAYAKEKDYKKISLWCLEDNKKAEKFYNKQGFIKTENKEEIKVDGKTLIKSRYEYTNQ